MNTSDKWHVDIVDGCYQNGEAEDEEDDANLRYDGWINHNWTYVGTDDLLAEDHLEQNEYELKEAEQCHLQLHFFARP